MERNYPYSRNPEYKSEREEEVSESGILSTLETVRNGLIHGGKGRLLSAGDDNYEIITSRKILESELTRVGWTGWQTGRLITYTDLLSSDQLRETVEMVLEASVIPARDHTEGELHPIVTDVKRILLHRYTGGDMSTAGDYEIKRHQLIAGEITDPLPLTGNLDQQAESLSGGHELGRQVDILYSGEAECIRKLIRRL